jgi:hypothetical protein
MATIHNEITVNANIEKLWAMLTDLELLDLFRPYDVYIWTSDIDALYEEFKIKNVNIIERPVKRQYGRREIVIKDCNDFKIAFAD